MTGCEYILFHDRSDLNLGHLTSGQRRMGQQYREHPVWQ